MFRKSNRNYCVSYNSFSIRKRIPDVHLTNGYYANARGLDMPLLIDDALPEQIQIQIFGQTSYNNNKGAIGSHHLGADYFVTNTSVNNLDGTSYKLDESLVNSGSADVADDDISEFLIFHKKRDDPKLATKCYVKLMKSEIYKQTEVKFGSSKTLRRRLTSVARKATFPGDSKAKGRQLIRVAGEGDRKIKNRRLTYPANAFLPEFVKDRSKAKHSSSNNRLPLKPYSRTTCNSLKRDCTSKGSKVSSLAFNEEPINGQPKIVLKFKKNSSTWCIVPQNQHQLKDCRVILKRLRTIDNGVSMKSMSKYFMGESAKMNLFAIAHNFYYEIIFDRKPIAFHS